MSLYHIYEQRFCIPSYLHFVLLNTTSYKEALENGSGIHTQKPHIQVKLHLVGGFNPSEKYAREIGKHLPQSSG